MTGPGAGGDGNGRLQDLLGVSPAMRALERRLAAVAAEASVSVLLVGEPGTGKEGVARAIHGASPRAAAPFVVIPCVGAIPGETTGPGPLGAALHGTAFFDEIGELPAGAQAHLATVVTSASSPARLMAATSGDLVAAVDAGRFREDLYYAISDAVVRLPPLRDRTADDRAVLLHGIVERLARELPGAPRAVDAAAVERLLALPWHGNLREMRNAIERAMMRARGARHLGAEHLPEDLRRDPGGPRPGAVSLRQAERELVARALRHHAGNRTHAARELGISRVTLLKKIRDYGLERESTA